MQIEAGLGTQFINSLFMNEFMSKSIYSLKNTAHIEALRYTEACPLHITRMNLML